MAITVQGTFTGNDYKTSAYFYSDTTISRSNVAVGDIIIVCLAADASVSPANVGLRDSVTEAGENYSLSFISSANNSGNVYTTIGWAYVDAIPSGSDPLECVCNNIGTGAYAWGITVYVVRGLDPSPFDKQASGTGSSSSPSSGATDSLSQADEIAIGAVGTEGPSNDTQGTWTDSSSTVSGNELYDGTNSNGATANVSISSAAEIVSATTAQTAAKTGISPRDWAACVATFKGAAEEGIVNIASALSGASGLSAETGHLIPISAAPAGASGLTAGVSNLIPVLSELSSATSLVADVSILGAGAVLQAMYQYRRRRA